MNRKSTQAAGSGRCQHTAICGSFPFIPNRKHDLYRFPIFRYLVVISIRRASLTIIDRKIILNQDLRWYQLGGRDLKRKRPGIISQCLFSFNAYGNRAVINIPASLKIKRDQPALPRRNFPYKFLWYCDVKGRITNFYRQ